jgi:hypothetical protein
VEVVGAAVHHLGDIVEVTEACVVLRGRGDVVVAGQEAPALVQNRLVVAWQKRRCWHVTMICANPNIIFGSFGLRFPCYLD